jgi:hypothetical protein
VARDIAGQPGHSPDIKTLSGDILPGQTRTPPYKGVQMSGVRSGSIRASKFSTRISQGWSLTFARECHSEFAARVIHALERSVRTKTAGKGADSPAASPGLRASIGPTMAKSIDAACYAIRDISGLPDCSRPVSPVCLFGAAVRKGFRARLATDQELRRWKGSTGTRTVCRPGCPRNPTAGATQIRVLGIEPEARGGWVGVPPNSVARANIDHTGPYSAASAPTRATPAQNLRWPVNRPALFSGASQDSPDGAVRCLGSARGQNPPAGPWRGMLT